MNLLMLLLINFLFVIVICDVPSPRRYRYSRETTYVPHELDSVSIDEEYTYSQNKPTFYDTDEHDPDDSAETTTTENPENNETTTEHTIETTSNDGKCLIYDPCEF